MYFLQHEKLGRVSLSFGERAPEKLVDLIFENTHLDKWIFVFGMGNPPEYSVGPFYLDIDMINKEWLITSFEDNPYDAIEAKSAGYFDSHTVLKGLFTLFTDHYAGDRLRLMHYNKLGWRFPS